ncbi:MAG: lipoate--protein ligase family protein [Sphingomonadales bacterium]|nr:lipoate--protein ligase family protein [Sphingomonadales bacterium]
MSDPGRCFVRALMARAPRPLLDLVPDDRQSMIDSDDELARALLDEPVASAATRIWTNHRCLVASRNQARLPTFPFAVEAMRRAGWPVATRRSGGTTVIHRPGILNVSLTLSGEGGIAVETGYAALLRLLADACRDIGLDADSGCVDGAICDGRFNLRHHGRKLAGTAAFVQSRAGRKVMVAHASVALDGSLANDLAAIRAFERALGREQDYAITAHTTLAAALHPAAGTEMPRRIWAATA